MIQKKLAETPEAAKNGSSSHISTDRALHLLGRCENTPSQNLAEIPNVTTNRLYSEISLDQSVEELKERICFEHLVSNLSARFVNLPAEEVDRQIEDGLRQMAEYLGVDRSSLLIFPQDPQQALVLYSWAGEGFETLREVGFLNELPWYLKKIRQGETLVFERLPEELPAEAVHEREYCLRQGFKSHVAIPIRIGGSHFGLMTIGSFRQYKTWPQQLIPRLRLMAEIFANALARKRADEELRKSNNEIKKLKERLEVESNYLRSEINFSYRHGEIIGQSEAIKKVLRQVEQVAATNSIVLIQGETGVGKDVVARAIHNLSLRKSRVMVRVNCASLPSALIESELFGREKGAYTGALTKQVGRFEVADGSTMFLDEIGELSLELQVKLLRVLQDGEFERLGSPKTIKVDVRVIAATNRDLAEQLRKGNFREDLYYRLNVFPIEVPALRQRQEDIPLFVWAFIDEFGEKMGKKIHTVPQSTLETLKSYPWPGNIRELRNVIEHAIIITTNGTLQVQLPEVSQDDKAKLFTLEEVERQHIIRTLGATNGRVKGGNGAAKLLGLKPSTLYSKMVKLGIPTSRGKEVNSAQ